MKLTKKSEYACLALIDLSENYGSGFVRTGDISRRKKIPKKYLEQILLLLKSGGYLRSMRGPEGGYMLLKPPGSVSVAEILRLTGDFFEPAGMTGEYLCETTSVNDNKDNKGLIELFNEIRNFAVSKMEKIKFSDLIKK